MLDKTETNLWYMEDVYYDNREKYKEIFEEEVISLPINPQIDLKEELHEESKYKAYLDLFTKIKKVIILNMWLIIWKIIVLIEQNI